MHLAESAAKMLALRFVLEAYADTVVVDSLLCWLYQNRNFSSSAPCCADFQGKQTGTCTIILSCFSR